MKFYKAWMGPKCWASWIWSGAITNWSWPQITTFAIHNGVYRYKSLIYELSSASEQFQHEIAAVLAGIEGVKNISDDIVVHAADQVMHNHHLHAVLSHLQQWGQMWVQYGSLSFHENLDKELDLQKRASEQKWRPERWKKFFRARVLQQPVNSKICNRFWAIAKSN